MHAFFQATTPFGKLSLLAVPLLLASAQANASLADRGDGTVYDDHLNAVWTKDANLFQTLAASNPSLVADVINSADGQINDSAGPHALNSTDFDTAAGTLSWYGAQAWAGYLNSIGYAGRQSWRLPTATLAGNANFSNDGSTDTGYNNTSGELGHLFYAELGNNAFYSTAGAPQSPYGAGNSGPFAHLTSAVYWTGVEAGADNAWYFATLDGLQDNFDKTSLYQAVAVAPVPVPAAFWLLGSALTGLATIGHRKQKAEAV